MVFVRQLKPRHERGFTIGELLVVMFILFVVGAIAIAILKRTRISVNESAAIGSMRAIVAAQASYASYNNAYAGSLEVLSTRCKGMDAGFITADMNHNGMTRSGYVLMVTPGAGAQANKVDCNGTPAYTVFYASAKPEILNDTGNRAFAANTTATIWQSTAGYPPTEPLVASATVTVIGR